MALTKASQTAFTSASLSAGSGLASGSWLAIGYGVTIIAKVTNGGTGPTTGVQLVVEVAEDGSGTNAEEVVPRMFQYDLTAGAITRWSIPLGIAGAMGDHSHYRVSFYGPTGQAVTALARAMTTTAL